MKKRRFNKSRILAALMSLCMIISLFNGIDLPHFFQNETIAQAENGGVTPDPDEYKEETLDYIWSKGTNTPDSTYWGAARPYYTCAADSEAKAKEGTFAQFGGVYKRTIFHVFAFAGDTICIGSSVKNSGIDSNNKLKNLEAGKTEYPDEDSVDVIMTDPYGNTIPIDITDGAGFIEKPGNEFAAIKMQSRDDGTFKGNCTINSVEYEYTPYTYPVQETGVYTFEFHSYNMVGCPQKNTRSTDWSTYTDIGGLIAAINLTVFDEKGDKQTGRTYADFLSLQMGNVGGGVKDAYYVLTKDSFIYKMKFNGASPYTYNFFANNKGIYDSSTGEIIYTSVKDINNDNTFDEMGAAYKYPGTKDTDMLKSYYIFLEYPDDQLEGYLYEKAVQPDPATNLRFVSTVNYNGSKVPGAYQGAGGYFAFDVEEATTATLRLEFTGTSFTDKGKFAPVEISGAVTPHSTNYFYWNGKDGNGKVIPVGEYDIKDLAFTVTTKAGEIHFPIIDMEFAKDGITFTRLSHIYSKDGTRLDYDDNIYGKTKNLIYYDDSAIYYGEPAASTGHSESNMSLALDLKNEPYLSHTYMDTAPKEFFNNLKTNPDSTPKYWTYNNMRYDGGEYQARDENNYVSDSGIPTDDSKIRIGDHSHTTNVIDYFDDKGNLLGDLGAADITEEQQKMIDYLDSKKFPVGKASGTSVYYKKSTTGSPTRPEDQNSNNEDNGYHWKNVQSAQTTTDYAIANFWTFIPSQPAVASTEIEKIEIINKPEYSFDLTGRVFFDVKGDGKFNDMTTDGDYPLKDVTLNLYKKIGATETYNIDNEYVEYKDGKITKLTADTFTSSNKNNVYKLIDTGLTTGEGMYRFTGLAYDPTNGTDYLYEVIKPGSSYSLTSEKQTANAVARDGMRYGYYADKSYNADYYGTEVQHIKVGGTDGIDPTKYGYNTSLAKPAGNVTVCAVDVGYNYALMAKSLTAKKKWASSVATDSPTSVVYEVRYDTGTAKKQLYNFWTVSPITAWQNEDEYLPADQSGAVTDYYVSAEYYIKDGYIYKHEFARKASGDDYESFVGTTSRVNCASLYTGELLADKPIDGIYTFLNLPDLNGDGSRNAWDLVEIKGWEKVDETTAPYRAVLDKNETASGTEITVTNSQNHGTIEIFKYHDSNEEANALQGATFRVYEGDIATVKTAIEGDGSPPTPVGEGTTRSNGRVAFPDLVPTQTYTVYERFAPDGYRILERYHQVVPRGNKAAKALTVEFDGENCAKLYIGNAIADTEFKIRKQITGRAWQDNDRFEFTITPMFKAYSTDKSGFVLDDGENVIFGGSGTENIDNTKIDSMASDITDSSDSRVKIDNDSSYYSYTSKRPGGSGEYTITSSTEKVSKGLLIDGKDGTAKAAFCGAAFPYAGVYTFEISEEKPVAAANDTLTYTSRVYTVQIKVVREFDEGRESDGIKNESNTHLTASVDSVTYKDTPTGSEQVFAGSSPVFVNEYHPAPAVQSTSYTINKELRGRDWVSNDDIQDNFTINVKAVDSATADAIKASQLRIYGFEHPEKPGVVAKNTDENGWVCTFTSTSNADIPFTAFVFDKIEFPVKYVDKDGKEWQPDPSNPEQTSPTEEDLLKGTYTAKTEPVEYWLDIFEDIPTEAVGGKLNGITYDAQHYYLHITLRNAEKTVSGGHTSAGEEEDGIIDEIDMALYHADKEKTVSELLKTDPVATCYTKAEVLEAVEWVNRDADTYDHSLYDWFYVNKDGGLQIVDDDFIIYPSDAKMLVRRYEEHNGSHTMTITNNYSAETTWTPKVQKVLEGRDWADNDSFTFEIKCTKHSVSGTVTDVDGYTMPAETSVTITNTTDAHTAPFGSITFNQPGTYIFKISETDHTGGSSITNDGPVYIKVTIEDNYDGTLKKTFEVVDSEGAAIADKTYNELDAITLTNTYKDEPKTFAFDIKKTIIGRNWKTDDSFIFTITPDEAAKKAITDGRLTMPDGLTPPETDSEAYTAEITYTDGSGTIEDVITKALGEITVNGLPADEDSAEYKFTITEVTADFEGRMLCRHNDITLTINVERAKDTNGIPTGLLNVSAYYTIDGEETTCFGSGDTDPTATIPFENISLGTLTVEKEVVSSNEDTMTFDFTVVFKFDNSGTNKFTKDEVKNITAKFGGESVTPTVSSDGYTYTYTFKLKHGEKITFSNILPNTTYTITENTEPSDYMFLRIMDKDGNNVYDESEGQKVSGTIDIKNSPYEYTFISGKIHNLPSAGGTGSQLILLGGLALIIAAALFYTLFHKNDKRREAR